MERLSHGPVKESKPQAKGMALRGTSLWEQQMRKFPITSSPVDGHVPVTQLWGGLLSRMVLAALRVSGDKKENLQA